MWEISNQFQWISFGRAVLLGILVCILYDIIRLYRFVFKGKSKNKILGDMIFWIINSFTTFCFLLLNTNGQPRLYVFVGMSLGFIIFRLTLSKLLFFLFRPIKKVVRKLAGKYINIVKKAQNFSFVAYIINIKGRIGIFLSKKRKIS